MVPGVLDLDPGHLVKGHCIPIAHQAYAFAVVVEQGRLGGLASADQRRVRGEFAEEIGFARASGAEFDEAEIGLHQRGQSGYEVQLQAMDFLVYPQFFLAGTCRGKGRKGIFAFRHAFSQAPRQGFGVANRDIVDVHQFH